jgi:hypothetical protein
MNRREPKPFWQREWLYNAYVVQGRSTSEIAAEFGCRDTNIQYFLAKHNIPRRSVSEARKLKHWGLEGKDNPMHGRIGSGNPNWKGGGTAERQAFYASSDWKKTKRAVWKRDGGRCVRCHSSTRPLHYHHVASFSYKHLRADPINVALVCRKCHHWIHSLENENKELIELGI